jgi:hypothetical protein
MQRASGEEERPGQPRRTRRGDKDTLRQRAAGHSARSDEREPNRDVHGGQPRARLRCLTVGTHGQRSEYPHDDNAAREDRHGALRPDETCGAHNRIVAAWTPRRQAPSRRVLAVLAYLQG